MKTARLLLLSAAVSMLCTPTFANLLTNGDFSGGLTGWTTFQAGWSGPTVTDASGGYLHLTSANGSFGVYQAITTTPGNSYTLTLDWMAAAGQSSFWNEVLFFNDDGRALIDQIDTAALPGSLLAKVDGWGMNPPTSWAWKSPFDGTQWFGAGPNTNTIVATGTTMYVALKGGVGGGRVDISFDNVSVVPEPGSMLVLASGLLGLTGLIRRKR